MIRKITFKNFYSFKEEQVLDFTTSKKKNDNYFTSYDGKQISKVIAFAGPNNSGKTNVMKLFGFIDFFMTVASRIGSGKEDLAFKPYAFCEEQPSKFCVEFETKSKLYTYYLEATRGTVIKEVLEAKKLEKSARKYNIFSREKNSIKVNKKIISGVTEKAFDSIRNDISTVAFLKTNYNINEINEISDYFACFRTNINEQGSVAAPEEKIEISAGFYTEHLELKKDMEEFIRDFDLDIEKFSIKKTDVGFNVSAEHKVNGKMYSLPIGYESRGTKSLFVELVYILNSINQGTVLALDEIESGLHPQAVDKLIQYITDKFSEDKKQFIFSSHSLNYMKRFDPQQMFLVEKNDSVSKVYRMDALNIRSDENFYAKYMSGSYGAFPKIRI